MIGSTNLTSQNRYWQIITAKFAWHSCINKIKYGWKKGKQFVSPLDPTVHKPIGLLLEVEGVMDDTESLDSVSLEDEGGVRQAFVFSVLGLPQCRRMRCLFCHPKNGDPDPNSDFYLGTGSCRLFSGNFLAKNQPSRARIA